MNAAAKRIDSLKSVDSQKTDLLQEIKIWKKKLLGSEKTVIPTDEMEKS